MSNKLRQFRRQKEKQKVAKAERREPKLLTKTAFTYECESCGKKYKMWLQTGLEEGGENHKPVPFVIRCKCGGAAKHIDWDKDVELPEPIEIKEHMNYFANYAKYDCGIPVLR